MFSIRQIISFFKINESAEELNRERHKAIIQQVPMMYAILAINMFALVWPHMYHAPLFLTLGVPSILTIIFLRRSFFFYRKIGKEIPYDQVVKDLNSTTLRTSVLGAVAVLWVYYLFQYGTPIMQAHIVFFLFFSLICCCFFLLQLPQAAVCPHDYSFGAISIVFNEFRRCCF